MRCDDYWRGSIVRSIHNPNISGIRGNHLQCTFADKTLRLARRLKSQNKKRIPWILLIRYFHSTPVILIYSKRPVSDRQCIDTLWPSAIGTMVVYFKGRIPFSCFITSIPMSHARFKSLYSTVDVIIAGNLVFLVVKVILKFMLVPDVIFLVGC